MELTPQPTDGRLTIDSFSPAGFVVDGTLYPGGIIICASKIITGFPATCLAHLTGQQLEQISSLRPELVLIGCGTKQPLPDHRLFVPLLQKGIGVEIMTTAAACRTYNVVVSEDRGAVAALMPLD